MKEEVELSKAKWLVEPGCVVLVTSGTMENANVMTFSWQTPINSAYPCLGFHQLNNEGLVGGCECDVRSTATIVAITALTQGRPGYISDPVIDTAKRQIIYAHCVASNRVFGLKGQANPFEILTHSLW